MKMARVCSLVVLGSGGVGKSTITLNFVSNKFIENLDPSVDDWYSKHIEIGGEQLLLHILGPGPQSENAAVRDPWLRKGEGFLVVYSITETHALEETKFIVEKILEARENADFPLVIVGNKSDLEPQRQVSIIEGLEFAKKYKAAFFETSAKFGVNVEQVFFKLAREVASIPETTPNKIKERKQQNCVTY